MATTMLQEENTDRGGRRKRKEGISIMIKEILWVIHDGYLKTIAAKEAIATKRKKEGDNNSGGYSSIMVEGRTSGEGRCKPRKEQGPTTSRGRGGAMIAMMVARGRCHGGGEEGGEGDLRLSSGSTIDLAIVVAIDGNEGAKRRWQEDKDEEEAMAAIIQQDGGKGHRSSS